MACELTGIVFSEDYTTMFVGIQHPREGLKVVLFLMEKRQDRV
ncbi:hypothetical protein [Campylobacter jejuni]